MKLASTEYAKYNEVWEHLFSGYLFRSFVFVVLARY